MAHFARMDGNTVSQVIVVHNNDAPDEATGVAFCRTLFGADTAWVQTSYNGNFRKQYAGIGYTYDPVADVFVAERPYPSWLLDGSHDWQPPTPRPDGDGWEWDEATLSWVQT